MEVQHGNNSNEGICAMSMPNERREKKDCIEKRHYAQD